MFNALHAGVVLKNEVFGTLWRALSLFQTQTKNMELTNILGEETRTFLYVKINYKIKVDKITK